MTCTIDKYGYNPNNEGLEVINVPKTFNEDSLNKSKVQQLDIFFQIIANEIRDEQEIIALNL